MILNVFGFLEPSDLVRVQATCRRLRLLGADDLIWRRHYAADPRVTGVRPHCERCNVETVWTEACTWTDDMAG